MLVCLPVFKTGVGGEQPSGWVRFPHAPAKRKHAPVGVFSFGGGMYLFQSCREAAEAPPVADKARLFRDSGITICSRISAANRNAATV